MKLILRADVDHLGLLGDIVDVKAGYGRNFLIPKGLAMPATASNQRVFEQERTKLQQKMDALRAEAMNHGEKIQAAKIEIPMRVGEGDKLYGSVTNAIIADALKEAIGEEIDRRKILLEEPIRALGTFSVPVKLHHDVVVDLSVRVMRHDQHLYDEQEAAEAAAKAAEAEAAATAAEGEEAAGQGESEAAAE